MAGSCTGTACPPSPHPAPSSHIATDVHAHTDAATDRQTYRQTCKRAGRQAGRQADSQARRQTGKLIDRQKDRQLDEQTDIQTLRQTLRQAYGQTDRQTEKPVASSKTQQRSIDTYAQDLRTGDDLEAVHVVVLQVGGHGEAQLISVLQQQLPARLLTHPLLHELVAGCAQACRQHE